MEGFVDRVKGRDGSRIWTDGGESIAQIVATDATYKRAGSRVRPSREVIEWDGDVTSRLDFSEYQFNINKLTTTSSTV